MAICTRRFTFSSVCFVHLPTGQEFDRLRITLGCSKPVPMDCFDRILRNAGPSIEHLTEIELCLGVALGCGTPVPFDGLGSIGSDAQAKRI